MARTNDPQQPRPRHLYVLPSPAPAQPLPAVVPLLRPDKPVTPAQDALLTALAQRARQGDRDARDLLWRSFSPRFEPAMRRCGRMTWRHGWVRRNGRPWELDDLRQEAWLVFADLIADWSGEGSFVPYATAHFPWRLRDAMRRLAPDRRHRPLAAAAGLTAECPGLSAAEATSLRVTVRAALLPADVVVLEMRLDEGESLALIARRLGVNRRTVNRRWARIRRVAREMLSDSPPAERATEDGSETR